MFSHALVGASLSALAPQEARRARIAMGLAALAVLPDLDVLGLGLGVPYAHPLGHRGFTHSIPFAAAVGCAVAMAAPTGMRPLRLGGLAFAACASHGLLDAFTDAGLGVGFWIPFDDARTFFPWRPLATSPIGVRSFFEGSAGEILQSELRWVGVPWAIGLGTFLLARRLVGSGRA